MNIKTKIISLIIFVYTLLVSFVAVSGMFLPTTATKNYIRQSVAQRQVQGGGINFGK